MKAVTIEALNAVVAALEELTEALKLEAGKSRGGADDEDTAEVPRSSGKTKVAAVSGKRKKPAADVEDLPDDDATDDATDDAADDDAPPPKKASRATAKTRKPARAAEVEPEDPDEPADDDNTDDEEDPETAQLRVRIKKLLQPHLEDPAVVKKVKLILKKYDATTVTDADADSLPAIKKAVVNLIAEL